MPFDIDAFRSTQNNKNGYIRTNKFHVRFAVPQLMIPDLSVARDLEFYCQDIAVPGYQLMTGNVRRWGYGPNESRPFAPNFQQIQLLVNTDGNMDTWNFFQQWLSVILPHDATSGFITSSPRTSGNTYELSYKTEYATDVEITVFNEVNQEKKKVFLRESFPSNMNQINLSWGDQNQIAQFTVFMEYLDWYQQAITTTPTQTPTQ